MKAEGKSCPLKPSHEDERDRERERETDKKAAALVYSENLCIVYDNNLCLRFPAKRPLHLSHLPF